MLDTPFPHEEPQPTNGDPLIEQVAVSVPEVDEATYAAVLAAETDAQRAACRPLDEDEDPTALELALQLRVQANLAATGGKPLQACGGADPDVRQIEEPYRKHRAADAVPEDEQPPPAPLDDPNPKE